MAWQHHAGCAAHGGAGQFLGGEAVGLPRSGCLSHQAKLPKLSLVPGRATAAMGSWRSRPPARPGDDSEVDEVMRRTDGRAVMPSPSALLSDGAHVFPGERAPCVSADAF